MVFNRIFLFLGSNKESWVSWTCKLMEEMLSCLVSQQMNEGNISNFPYTLFSINDVHCKRILQVSYVMLALVAHYMHCILTLFIFYVYLSPIFAFFFPPSHPLINFLPLPLSLLLEILDQMYLIYYTMIMIHYSQYLMLHYYQKKTSLRSVCQLPWPPYWLPWLSGKETKMPNIKKKQHMISLSQSSQGRHWTLRSNTHCHYLLCSCLLVYVSHQNLTHLLQNIQSK